MDPGALVTDVGLLEQVWIEPGFLAGVPEEGLVGPR